MKLTPEEEKLSQIMVNVIVGLILIAMVVFYFLKDV